MAIDYKETFFNARDGIRLFLRSWSVPQPKGLIAILHGFAEHSGRYVHLAEVLVRAGWAVAAVDLRGHGQSGGRRCHVDRFDDYLTDTQAFLAEIGAGGGKARQPVLLGHSQGGLIAARFAEIHPDQISMLILSSPYFGLAMKVPAIKVIVGKALSGVLPTLSIKTGIDPAILSHDAKMVEQYATDPLVGRTCSTRWYTEVTKIQALSLQEGGLVQLPMLQLQAGDDRLASFDAGQRFFNSVASRDKTFKKFEGFFHEIFNEVGREQVFKDLCGWLAERVA